MYDHQKSIISYLRDDKFADCDFKLVMMRQETQLLNKACLSVTGGLQLLSARDDKFADCDFKLVMMRQEIT